MSTKYEAFDASGKRHTRITAGRTYTHCVVKHFPAYDDRYHGRIPAYDKTSWAGSLALAQKEAARVRDGIAVEIIEAQVQEGKR
jgi:hypothetical protein